MSKKRKKILRSTKIKRFKVRSSASINTGHMEVQPEPTLPMRDAMSALWEGQFKQCIELFNRRNIIPGNIRQLWLVYRQSTYIFMEEDFPARLRRFSIFFGSEDRAMSYISKIPWARTVLMDDTKVEHDRTVQSPRLWRVPRYPALLE